MPRALLDNCFHPLNVSVVKAGIDALYLSFELPHHRVLALRFLVLFRRVLRIVVLEVLKHGLLEQVVPDVFEDLKLLLKL